MGNVLDIKTRQALVKEVHRKQLVKELGEPTSNFFRVSHLTLEHPSFKAMSPQAKVLFFILCSHRNRYQGHKTYFTRSFRQLSRDTNMSVNTVRRAQAELITNRFLLCVHMRGGRTRYQIMDVRSPKNLL